MDDGESFGVLGPAGTGMGGSGAMAGASSLPEVSENYVEAMVPHGEGTRMSSRLQRTHLGYSHRLRMAR